MKWNKKILKKKFAEAVKDIIDDKKLSVEDIEFWFQDEARFGQQGTITRMWAPKGTRPRAIKQAEFECAYFFAAVCPSTGQASAIVLPHADSEAMQMHLDMISRELAPGKHAIIITDRASWHRSLKLKIPPNITLLFLPPYSPELNGAEKIWDFMRQKSLANRAFESYDHILDACADAWQAVVNETGRLSSLCAREWAKC